MFTASLLLTGAMRAPASGSIPITVTPALGAHHSGRLIVFAERLTGDAKPADPVDFDKRAPTKVTIAGREIADLVPGRVARVDGETDAFPDPLSALAPGRYRLQAVLDRNHDYSYAGRGAGDLVSPVVTVALPGPIPTLVLDHAIEATVEPDEPALLAAAANIQPIAFVSPSLTAFFGTPTAIRGWVALPPDYDGTRRFPTIYWTDGFGGTLRDARTQSLYRVEGMRRGAIPPMIWIQLDQSGATGTHEFADSANNGPWGKALTTELIPALERQYAMDARPSGRFLMGHSSGGWSALWLQVAYPKLFGGAWATAPDPTDFHEFSNVNLYAADANFYMGSRGEHTPLARDKGAVAATTEQYARSETVLGSHGGQLASFEWVFSPRGADGQPLPLFDRVTGRIDPIVAAYWRDRYDIAHIVKTNTERLRSDLAGKVHLFVGTADNYYLD